MSGTLADDVGKDMFSAILLAIVGAVSIHSRKKRERALAQMATQAYPQGPYPGAMPAGPMNYNPAPGQAYPQGPYPGPQPAARTLRPGGPPVPPGYPDK